MDGIGGKQKFFKLVKNGRCEFDEFESEARRNYNSEMNSIYHRISLKARGVFIPESQFKILKGAKLNITEFEIKSKSLRIYFVIDKKVKTL